jgi:hypothetical protein
MPKILPSIMGYRIQDILPKKESHNLVIERLRMAINEGVCVKESQKSQIAESLANLQRLSDATDIVGRYKFFACLERIITMINSFRLDCGNCLNGDCQDRDPDFPIKAVHERTGHTPISHKKPDKKK